MPGTLWPSRRLATPRIMSRSLVQDGNTTVFLAGDTSYNEALMLAGMVDGASADEQLSLATLDAIRAFVQSRPTVYLPTHDPASGARLANRRPAGG